MMDKKNAVSRKVDFSEYKGKYDENVLKELLDTKPTEVDLEMMREQMYGYASTEAFAKGEIPDILSMDYWRDKADERLFSDEPVEDDDEEADITLDDLFGDNVDSEDDFDIDPSLREPQSKLSSGQVPEDDYEIDTPQERILLDTISTTGDGKSAETAMCVIDVHQEYEFISRVFPYSILKVVRQSLVGKTVDCLTFEENDFGVDKLYFDISCTFHQEPWSAPSNQWEADGDMPFLDGSNDALDEIIKQLKEAERREIHEKWANLKPVSTMNS